MVPSGYVGRPMDSGDLNHERLGSHDLGAPTVE